MKPSILLWILTSLILITITGCGLPVGVYLSGDVITPVPPISEKNPGDLPQEFSVDLSGELRYDKNGLRFFYSLGEAPIDSKHRTLNHIIINFNDDNVMYHDLFKDDLSRNLFNFHIQVNTDDADNFVVSYEYVDDSNLASGNSNPIDIDLNSNLLMFIYAQYVVEGFVVGKVQPETDESPVIHIATYRIGE